MQSGFYTLSIWNLKNKIGAGWLAGRIVVAYNRARFFMSTSLVNIQRAGVGAAVNRQEK